MASEAESWWTKETIAVVTGANKGIGKEMARQLAQHGLTVILTARDPAKGQSAIQSLKAEGLDNVIFHPLDISRAESIQEIALWLEKRFGGLNILINNAAIGADEDTDYETAKAILDTNYFGTKKVIKVLLPLFKVSSAGARIVNVTSRAAAYQRFAGEALKQICKDEEAYSEELADSLAAKYLGDVKEGRISQAGWISEIHRLPMYSESKLFLNIFAAAFGKSLSETQPGDHRIFVVTFCPGLIPTDLYYHVNKAGFSTPPGMTMKTLAEGADTGVWLSLLPKQELLEKNGKFFAEREEYALGADSNF